MNDPEHLLTPDITQPCPLPDTELTRRDSHGYAHSWHVLIKFTSSYLEPDVKQSFQVCHITGGTAFRKIQPCRGDPTNPSQITTSRIESLDHETRDLLGFLSGKPQL
ncbi:hypothetical protein D1007_42739 [Hordeum vulgare]|nr:hypothetical protein D1007_42739 [Hordeum vulgare]